MDDIIYKSYISEVTNDLQIVFSKKIYYRIINVDNTFFFAEEIATGAIFPIYCFKTDKREKSTFLTHSYLKFGYNYVFAVIKGTEGILGKYEIDHERQREVVKVATKNEIDAYLERFHNDYFFNLYTKGTFESYEQKNIYECDLALIKEKVKEAKLKTHITDFYIPAFDISHISNLISDLSYDDDLEIITGRENELDTIIKNTFLIGKSTFIIGTSGSGKTSLVKKLAAAIKERKNPILKDKMLIKLDTLALTSDTDLAGTFEAKLKSVIDFCRSSHGKVVLFIDEIHVLYGLGRTRNSSSDAINFLKPYLENGEIVIIGATTPLEFQNYLALDEAFCGRFKRLVLNAPDDILNIEILTKYIENLKEKYNLEFPYANAQTTEIIKFIIETTDPKHQNIVGSPPILNPRLAKDVLSVAFSEAKYNNRQEVTTMDICTAIKKCEQLSVTTREEKAQTLARILKDNTPNNSSKVVDFQSYQK